MEVKFMSNLLCPFLQDKCNFKCVFNNGCFEEDDKENCDLLDAIQTIRSFQQPNNQVDKQQQEMISQLKNIQSNTGSDQTYSYDIMNILEDIKRLLEKKN